MARPPKQYNSDDETQRLKTEYTPYLTRLYVPSEAVRGVIRALLKEIQLPNLNRQAAENALMADLLFDNRELDEAVKRSRTYSTEDESITAALSLAHADAFLASVLCGERGHQRVKRVLEEYTRHSAVRMREESDEVLKALESYPSTKNIAVRKRWVHNGVPSILGSLKSKHSCFQGCAGRIQWPPDDQGAFDLAPTRDGKGRVSLKNQILAYFHGIRPATFRHYLEGIEPKTVSRSSAPRS